MCDSVQGKDIDILWQTFKQVCFRHVRHCNVCLRRHEALEVSRNAHQYEAIAPSNLCNALRVFQCNALQSTQ